MRDAPPPDDDAFVHYAGLPWFKGLFVGSVGGFLTLFLIAFLPFGVSNHDPDFSIGVDFLVFMAGAGLSVALALAVSEFVLRPLLLPAAGRRALIAWLVWDYLLAGSVAFVYYNHLGGWHDLSWPSYAGFLRDVALVISFPVAACLFLARHLALSARLVHLSRPVTLEPHGSPTLLHLSSENGKDLLTVDAGDILFLESQDNYVTIVFLQDGQRASRLLRSSLSRLASALPPAFVRCHRSFVVNLDRISACHGNRHGLKLHFPGSPEPVPASRAHAPTVLEYLGAGSTAPLAT